MQRSWAACVSTMSEGKMREHAAFSVSILRGTEIWPRWLTAVFMRSSIEDRRAPGSC